MAWTSRIAPMTGRLTLIGVALWSSLLQSSVAYAKTTSQPAAPFNQANPFPGILETLLGLCIVLILAFLSIRFMARRTNVRDKGSISLIAVRQVAPSKSVQVIEVKGRQLLIGVAEQITLLADITDDLQEFDEDDELAAAVEKSETQPFHQVLASSLQQARQQYGHWLRKGDNDK